MRWRTSGRLAPAAHDAEGVVRHDTWSLAGVGTVSRDGRLWLGWVHSAWGEARIPAEWVATTARDPGSGGLRWLRLAPHVGQNPMGHPVAPTRWSTSEARAYPYIWLGQLTPAAHRALPALGSHRAFPVVRRLSERAIWVAELDLGFPGERVRGSR